MTNILTSRPLIIAIFSVLLPIAIASTACEVSVCSEDDDDCEFGDSEFGEGSAGSSANGGSSSSDSVADPSVGGSSQMNLAEGSSGSAGTLLDCHEEGAVQGTPGETSPTVSEEDRDYDCQECAERLCATELADCYASGPDSVCLSGTTPLMDGGGEFGCMFECFVDLGDDFAMAEEDVVDCAQQCASNECEGEAATAVTQDLMRCLLDTQGQDESGLGCNEACDLINPL